VTGSVAASVTDKTIGSLSKIGDVKVVVTSNATRFMDVRNCSFANERPYIYANMIQRYFLLDDQSEWDEWENENVLHIDLKDWADVVVVAPLSANTLAKIWAGQCDNLLTSVIRACPSDMPIVWAPAMNTDMWNNPITDTQLEDLIRRYPESVIAHPVRKTLACGVEGIGAMAEAAEIARLVDYIHIK
jgi:phosphopantothenoylcysteine decarboxylase